MTEQEKKKMQDKMTPQLAAKVEYLMHLVILHSDGLANALTELSDAIEACGCESDLTFMRDIAKSIKRISESITIGGGK